MERLPEPQPRYRPDGPDAPHIRVIHLSTSGRPRTLLGRILLGAVSVAVLVAVLFLSIIAFAVIACLAVIGIGYLLWKTRHVRKAIRESGGRYGR